MASRFLHETEIIARVMREQRENKGCNVTLSIEDVPREIGSYAVYDGLDICGGGTTRNMRESIENLASRDLKRPIFTWKADIDGTDALWLEGKIRCSRCRAEMDIDDLDAHNSTVHGIFTDEGSQASYG